MYMYIQNVCMYVCMYVCYNFYLYLRGMCRRVVFAGITPDVAMKWKNEGDYLPHLWELWVDPNIDTPYEHNRWMTSQFWFAKHPKLDKNYLFAKHLLDKTIIENFIIDGTERN